MKDTIYMYLFALNGRTLSPGINRINVINLINRLARFRARYQCVMYNVSKHTHVQEIESNFVKLNDCRFRPYRSLVGDIPDIPDYL